MTRRDLLKSASVPAFARSMAAAGPVRRIHSQPSWVIRTGDVELAVTELGGHMAPVLFERRSGRPVAPYHISPWQDEGLEIKQAVLVPLRGDFFCLPFGGGREPDGREHPGHGETASSRWSFAGVATQAGVTTLTLTLETKIRPGKVTKRLMLAEGHNAVYSEHQIEGFAGRTTPGHHATLRLPEQDGALRLATSAFVYGSTRPGKVAERQRFASGAEIRDLRHVPLGAKPGAEADMTSLPARTGSVDLMAIYKRPASEPAWMTAVNRQDGYVWFSLKDAAVLPGTVFWFENRGTLESPWNGRNRCLGLEDVCWYFDQSYDPNPVTRLGIPTAMEIGGARPVSIRYIQGAVRAPAGFDVVEKIEFAPAAITLVSASGQRVRVPVRHEFLKSGSLA